MINNEEKNLLMNQVQTDVSLISFLSVISVFFIGALLPQFSSNNVLVKIPISFLVISTFAFLFSGLILSNSSQKIAQGNEEAIKKHLTYGYAISEYLGVFLFVVSVPLALSIITSDLYLRVVTFCAAIIGLGVYQFMGFSLLENHFSKRNKIFALLILLFGIVLFLAQVYTFHFTLLSIIFLCFMFLVTALAPVKKFQ